MVHVRDGLHLQDLTLLNQDDLVNIYCYLELDQIDYLVKASMQQLLVLDLEKFYFNYHHLQSYSLNGEVYILEVQVHAHLLGQQETISFNSYLTFHLNVLLLVHQ
jgi:hypothetical protein